MLNKRIAQNRIWEGSFFSSWSSQKWIVEFNWYDFTSFCISWKYGTAIETWSIHWVDNIEIESYVSSIIDWGWIINKKLWNKNITFSVFIQWESFDDLIIRIDEFKRKTQWVEGFLDIKVLWTWRRYTATISEAPIPSIPFSQDFIEWIQVSFLITSWTWEEYQPTSYVLPVIWETFKNIKNSWSYKAYPYFRFAFWSSWNSLSKITLRIRKQWETSWNELYIEWSFWNNDLIIFDYKKSTVTQNGDDIRFSNPMTPFPTGDIVVEVVPVWTINAELTISFNKTYL